MTRLSPAPRIVNADTSEDFNRREAYLANRRRNEARQRNTAVTAPAIISLSDFYHRLDNATEADWQHDWGHPYGFMWHDDVFREQVLHWLVGSDKRQTGTRA